MRRTTRRRGARRHRCRTLPGLTLAASLALTGLLGCGGDGTDGTDAGPGVTLDAAGRAGARATLGWRVRCESGRCPATEPSAREIDAYDGQDGHTVSCNLTLDTDGMERRLDLTARLGDQYGIEVRGAKVGPMGGRLLGSLGQVRVYESADTTVFAPVSSNLPTADRACQIQRVDIRDVGGTPTLTGELRCDDAPAEGDATRLRDVTAPMSASGYATFTFTGCVGL